MTLALFLFATQDQDSGSASATVSLMLDRYAKAKTVTGTIRSTIEFGDTKIAIDTLLDVEKPAKIRIRQVASLDPNTVYLVTSDGKQFSYNKPVAGAESDQLKGGRLVEPVGQMELGDIYRAATTSIAERSMPIDVVIGRRDDLQLFVKQVTGLSMSDFELDGKAVKRIVGQWRPSDGAPVQGVFGLYVTDRGDLVRYIIQSKDAEVEVVRVWDVDLKVDESLDQSVFKVVK